MLKSLELFGFKSFADRTTFEFADGVTCVVGPNGSGKSNVVDALKWILGDQSAKSLRGKEMSDVIFNGSAGRKASNFAEATLTFDNATRLLPMDAAEVKIGRRLYASGDSEYLLNGGAVRLKDVRELFMGTGAGTAAYSIIEQGRVDQILQANPVTRRLVFEEAAGISRYKARKVEAQRRLERVDQNLLRLRDIVDTVESRLSATQSQAAKAAKYREFSTEYKQLWTGLAADDYRESTSQLRALTDRRDQQQQLITETDTHSTSMEEQLAGFDAEAGDLDERIRHVERKRSTGREAIARHETAIRHQTTQSDELSVEIDRLRSQRNVLRRQVRSIDNELAETADRLETFESDFETQSEALGRREQRIVELGERLTSVSGTIDVRRVEREQLRHHKTAHEQEAVSLNLRREATIASGEQSTERTAALIAVIAAATAERESLQEQQRQSVEAVAAAQARIEHARAERRKLKNEQGVTERELAKWREDRSAKVARLHLLEDLEERHEGLNLGVREILQRAASSNEGPWSLVRGNVGDLLQAELGDAPLLEVALGSRVQLLVVDDLSPMIDYLNTAVTDLAGRVGFIEVTETNNSDENRLHSTVPVDLSALPGVISRADRLVISTPVPRLAEQLLADTWIVETLDVALRLKQGDGRDGRFVTLQGELLEADGTLFVGTAPNETAVISRKSELRLLRNEVRTLNARIEQEDESLQSLDATLLDADGELAALQASLNERKEELTLRRSAHESQVSEYDRLLAAHLAAESETVRLQTEQDSIVAELADLKQTLTEDDAAIVALAEAIERTEQATATITGQLQELQQASKVEQLELAKHEERLSSLQSAQRRLLDDQRQQQAQVDQADTQLAATKAKQWEIAHAILTARSELADRFLTDDACGAEVRSLHQHRSALRAQRREIQQQQDDLRDRRRGLTDAVHSIEIQTRDLQRTLAGLAERIEEEFAVSLPDIAEQGVSAYLSWIEPDVSDVTSEDVAPPAIDERNALDGETLNNLENGTLDDTEAFIDIDATRPSFDEVRGEIEERVERLRRKIKNLGSVNADSLNDLDELESKFNELSSQLADLGAAKAALEDIIRRINVESRRLFIETFETIRVHFKDLYRKLFGGGEGDIILEDPDDVLECGIDIVARPPGKELRSISLLSGGEKTMTAVGLLFAMFKSKPSPYCILDEVDAALDEANVDRYVSVVKEFRESTQFIIITHRKRTMTAADRLYGVTMEQAGVSKRLNVQFDDVREDGNFETGKAAA